ncbi:MAG: glycosyltransferase, partial [Candidatus Kapaibacteriota bacterium]
DRSTDKTAEIVQKYANNQSNIKLINVANDAEKFNIPGKAGAVHLGVEYSCGEIIFVTDADCKIRPQWIKKILPIYKDRKIGFVTSFTNVIGNRLFDKIQAIEWIYMHTMAMGGVGLDQPLGCYGNNLTFRKDYYLDFGGYKSIPFSVTEDLALQKAFHNNKYQIYYCIDEDILVDTKPCKNLKEYFAQHHRWARGGLSLGWKAAIFVLSSFAIWAGMLYFLIVGNFLCFLSLLFIRIVGDFALISPSLLILNRAKLLLFVPLAVLFFLIVEFAIPFVILKRDVIWKNQVFRTT